MSAVTKIQKFGLVIRRAGELVLYRLSSNFVQMKDGGTLQEVFDTLTTDVSKVKTRATNIETKLSGIGNFSSSYGEAVSVDSGTGKSVQAITFDKAGDYLIVANLFFGSNKTGRRLVKISATSGDVSTGRGVATQNATGSGGTYMVFTKLMPVTAGATYHINVYQNSGSTIAVYSSYQAVQISGS